MGAHGGPLGAPVGQGRLRGRGPGEVRPARPRDAHDAAPRRRPRARARRGRGRPRHHPPGARGVRAARARPTPSACSRWRAARRWPRCRACAPSASTTSWWRWRSSAPGPSRAGRCTPTCAGATARSRSPTRTRCWRSAWRRPSACRCSRSSSCRWRSTSPGSRRGSPTGCARRWGRSARGRGWRRCATGSSSGMAERGITGEVADDIVHKIEGFADFGFPESHSVSFAYLVYASSWIKLHYPTEFACALLNAQPMGFYSPHTIVRDATRHGVEVLGPCVQASRRDCTLEPRTEAAGPIGRPRAGLARRPVDPRHAGRAPVRARALRARAPRPHRRRAGRAALHRPRRLHPSHRRTHRRARGPRHRGRVRVLRPQPARGAVGRGRAARRACPTSCRAWSPVPTRRRCRG